VANELIFSIHFQKATKIMNFVCEIVQNILIYKNVIGRRKKKECDEVQ
jgi:hypothetical protein